MKTFKLRFQSSPSARRQRLLRRSYTQRKRQTRATRRPRMYKAQLLSSTLALFVASLLTAAVATMALVPIFPKLIDPIVRFACPYGRVYQAPERGMVRATFGSERQIFCILEDGSLQNHSLQATIYTWFTVTLLLFIVLMVFGGVQGRLRGEFEDPLPT